MLGAGRQRFRISGFREAWNDGEQQGVFHKQAERDQKASIVDNEQIGSGRRHPGCFGRGVYEIAGRFGRNGNLVGGDVQSEHGGG